MTDLKVTQADRQLLVEVLNPCSSTAESIQQGKSYTWEVGQIARHRIAAEEGKAELVEAVQRWVDATDAIAEFERDHPNGSTSRWDRLFYERGFASDALRAALARVRGEG